MLCFFKKYSVVRIVALTCGCVIIMVVMRGRKGKSAYIKRGKCLLDKEPFMFAQAVESAIKETKNAGNPIARYDRNFKRPYLEYPDGRKEYA